MSTNHRKLLLLPALLALTSTAMPARAGLTVAYPQYLWPPGSNGTIVYYVIDNASGTPAYDNIEAAIKISNDDFPGVLQWMPWDSMTDGPNYVEINLDPGNANGVCEANEGYEARPAQPMTGSGSCTIGTILHEMGHVIGLWHEQTRPDRASYVALNYANVIKSIWPSSSYEIATDNQQIMGPYDYASVMQYIPFAFSRNGGPVIESIPAGIPLAGYEGVPAQSDGSTPAQPNYDYSAGDKEAILRLYGAAPTQVTVTSNPVGLSVIVDGVSVKTPKTYSWPLWSTHTLDVSPDVQTISGYVLNSAPPTLETTTYYYSYGRWNDSTAQSHTIQVLPGDGSPRFPSTSPLLATYSANFIQLVPYTTPVISPTGSGTAAVSPSPQSYTGSSDEFFVARQEVTLTATANSPYSFYEFNNSPFWLPGALGANPKTFYVPDTGNPVDPTAEFASGPVYTVDVLPAAFSSNLYAYVDGNKVYTPKNYSPQYDSTWTPTSKHTLDVDAAEAPNSLDSRYNFVKWSDGGAQSHTTAPLPKTSKTYTATTTPEYFPWTNFNYPPCGGAATMSPASPTGDGFYPTGQQLSLNATPAPNSDAPWLFAGWTYDVTGTANPATLKANGETLVFANFNTVAAPLTLTSLKPSSAKAGAKGFTLTLKGTGFSPSPSLSTVSVNGTYPTVTYVNEETLTVPVTAAQVATPGAFQVFVENYPSGWSGCAVFGYQTFLVEGIGALTAKPAITPKTATYSTPPTVSISDAAPGATIYYTLDGTTPTTSSPVYSAPFVVSTTTTVKARASDSGFRLSAVATAVYTIN